MILARFYSFYRIVLRMHRYSHVLNIIVDTLKSRFNIENFENLLHISHYKTSDTRHDDKTLSVFRKASRPMFRDLSSVSSRNLSSVSSARAPWSPGRQQAVLRCCGDLFDQLVTTLRYFKKAGGKITSAAANNL